MGRSNKFYFFSAKEFSDPAALCFESIKKGQDMGLNLLLIDTAGRLHNKKDLMDELSKKLLEL